MLVTDVEFGRSVKRRRKDLALSQTALADLMRREGVTYANQSTVSRIERADRPLRLGEAMVLIQILDSNMGIGDPR